MAAKIYLPVVQPEEADSIIENSGKSAVVFQGDELDENLACGSCKQIVGRRVSTATIYRKFRPESRLILHCLCGAYILFPSNPA